MGKCVYFWWDESDPYDVHAMCSNPEIAYDLCAWWEDNMLCEYAKFDTWPHQDTMEPEPFPMAKDYRPLVCTHYKHSNRTCWYHEPPHHAACPYPPQNQTDCDLYSPTYDPGYSEWCYDEPMDEPGPCPDSGDHHEAPPCPNTENELTDRTVSPQRGAILDQAKAIINGERQDQYGNPEDSFDTIAELWSVYLEHDITSHDVAMMMALMKIARQKHQHKPDNFVDACGYLALAADMEQKSK
jgi:hypothetical protein